MADIARLKVIYNQGGFYFDTDVELLEPIENFIKHIGNADTFFLFLNSRYVNTGCGFGAIEKSDVIKHLLDTYLPLEFSVEKGLFGQQCTPIETDALEKYYSTFKRNNATQTFEDQTIILSTTVWSKFLKHLGTGTWVDGGRTVFKTKNGFRRQFVRKKFRNPKIFHVMKNVFGKKGEYLYEFLVYDLFDMGLLYFIKRYYKRIFRK